MARNLLARRLALLEPRIAQICKISGTPGASIAVMQSGETIFTSNYGFQDIEAKTPPNEKTIYHVASLTKGIAGAVIGILVDENKLKWNTPLVEILPEFQLQDPNIGRQVNIVDILSHRVGIAGGNALWTQGGNRNHVPKAELLRILASLKHVENFRDSFLYHNLLYGLVDEVVQKLTGQTFGNFATERIFKPLRMDRTHILASESRDDNHAKAYMPMDNGTFVEIPRPETGDATIQSSAGGVRSSTSDFLIYYDALMRTRKLESKHEESNDSPFKQAKYITSGHNFVSQPQSLEKSYACGLLRTQTPGTFGDIGPNAWLVDNMPTIGTTSNSQLVLFGQGSYPGFLSSAFLLPDSETVIVVLTNSLAFNDAADWIGQLILEGVLGIENGTDFESLATTSRSSYLKNFANVELELEVHRDPKARISNLENYVGDYFNSLNNFYIRIFARDSELFMCFQGEMWDTYQLKPYQDGVLYWFIGREEQARRGRWPLEFAEYFKFKFPRREDGELDHFVWEMDGAVPEGERFTKRSVQSLNHESIESNGG